uniref:Putative Smr domain-containing protein n=1 Tax=Davidia involucrata TaxID=16924 RepID=A0A5B7BXI7_DAVIN
MKHAKKKKRSRSSKRVGGKDGPCDEENKERMVLKNLMEAFASVSLEGAASAYREAKGDPNKAAVILQGLAENANDQTVSSCSSGSSGSSSSSSSCSSDVFAEANCGQNSVHGKGFRGSKPKKVVAATGTISTVLGKDYVSSSPRRDLAKSKGRSNVPVSKEDAEQFLCSMLGDESELSMAVVEDVLCQCGYDVEKAMNVLLELSASSYEQSKNGQSCDHNANIKERQFLLECSDNLTDEASDSTNHSSESELQDNMWSMGYRCRNYSEVLAGSQVHSSTSPRGSASELSQKVLESLFNMPKSSEHEPNSMNWRNVVKKIESLGQRFESCPSGTAEQQQHTRAKGDDYQVFRKAANQHWDSMKSYYQKAATAYSNGEREYAAYLSEQGRLSNKMARQADEKASQEIFEARNKSIENVITIDLHGQHVKQAIGLLKLHLLFGAYVRSIQSFRVITGCGSHGVGKSKLKQSVIDLVEREGIEWTEENRGTVLIMLEGQREFSFLDSESDSE